MVHLYKALCNTAKKPLRKYLQGQFIDSLRLNLHGGHGGNGVPKYGGIGGQGGCIYFEAKEGVSLRNVTKMYSTKRIKASSGEDSSKYRILGRRGVDEKIEVPLGVQVIDETGTIIGELNKEGDSCLAAGGGIGGCTGTSFLGKPGESKIITLDLKLIADIGLVGFPNAGKSTLLKAVSNASPRIASYPFTTVRPQLGIIEYPDYRTISVADLPGLIEGAHANIGMGHKFLKHVERTRLLLMMVDIFGFQLSQTHAKRDCLQNIYSLNRELELYDKTLLDKPFILLVNKMDMTGAKKQFENIQPILNDLEQGLDKCPDQIRPEKLINFERIIPISAKESANTNLVKESVRQVLDEIAELHLLNSNNFHTNLESKLKERGPRIT